MAEVNSEKLHIRLHVYDEEIDAYAQAYKGRKGEHTIALMTLIDIALLYERELASNDTDPYNDVLAKLTSEVEKALK